MSVSSIINPATGKIYDELAPQGGGVPLAKGGLITADATGKEQALVVGNNGWVLSANSAQNLGLEYIQLPAGGIQFTQEGQLLYAGAGPAFQDSLLNIGNAGQILGINAGIPAWINAGGSGTITALAPLTEYADGSASKLAIDFTAKGDLVVGGGPQAGGNPIAGVILPVGANDMVLTANSGTASGLEWKASGGGSSATIFRNSQDNTPLTITPPATANDTCIITADRVYNDFNSQIYNVVDGGGVATATQSFILSNWTPTNNISITSITANVKLSSTSLTGTDAVVALCAINDPTTIYSTSNTTSFIGEFLYNFTGFDNLPYEVVAGTQYSFYVLITLQAGETYNYYIDDPQDPNSKIGNITVVGTDYPAGAVATFSSPITVPPTPLFREANDITGKTSATCESFSSQSFVASQDLKSWICVGARNGGVAFVP